MNGNSEQQKEPKEPKGSKTDAKEPTKFLVVSKDGDGADLAWQLVKEGNAVKMYVAMSENRDVGDGFVDKVDDWKANVEWADVVVFCHCGYAVAADTLRSKGKMVIGGSRYTDRLEMDREFGQTEMKEAGMLVLPHWNFDNFEDGIAFLKENPGRYVFKPSGRETMDWEAKSLLFIGEEEDGLDIVEVLEHNKKAWSKKIKRFQLQKYAAGVEIAAGAFFNGTDFITPVNINFEHKKLFPGDIGPYTGEMGTLMFWADPNAFFNATLGKMKDKLQASKYVGYIDINCIANAKGIYPLEFTTRFGYPTISIQMEGVTSPWGDFFQAIAKGENYPLKTKRGFQVGAVVAIPPFPYYDWHIINIFKDSSVIFKKQNGLDGIHLGEVKLVDGDWHVAGGDGYVAIVTGAGSTVEDARSQMYRRIDNVMIQNMFYRTDIGEKWGTESDKLQTWGVL